MPLVNYQDFADKDASYACNHRIDTENELRLLMECLEAQENLIIRGVSEAKYRMYSSSQRHWITNDGIRMTFMAADYRTFILQAIERVKYDELFSRYFCEHQIPVNDIVILAMLQHYANISPLLDFTTDAFSALFFAQDGAGAVVGNGQLDDYISLYAIDKRCDWMQATLQRVNQEAAQRADSLLEDLGEYIDTADVEQDFTSLNFSRLEGLDFIRVEGPERGVVEAAMPYINFRCQYFVDNPRLTAQSGQFILNNTETEPLAEVMNSVINLKIIQCYNIHKNLIPHVNQTYLEPRGISRDTLYCNSEESRMLESRIKELFGI